MSEIARLRKIIEEQYEAAKRGLMGLSSGSARHQTIAHMYDSISPLFPSLVKECGDENKAYEIVLEIIQPFSNAPEKKEETPGC